MNLKLQNPFPHLPSLLGKPPWYLNFLRISLFKFLSLPPSLPPSLPQGKISDHYFILFCSELFAHKSKLLTWKLPHILKYNTYILLKRIDTSSSNSPPQHDKIQIPHLLGMDNGQMLVFFPGTLKLWIDWCLPSFNSYSWPEFCPSFMH